MPEYGHDPEADEGDHRCLVIGGGKEQGVLEGLLVLWVVQVHRRQIRSVERGLQTYTLPSGQLSEMVQSHGVREIPGGERLLDPWPAVASTYVGNTMMRSSPWLGEAQIPERSLLCRFERADGISGTTVGLWSTRSRSPFIQ
ncbi:hypothetical protein KBY55_28080 [Streptomyces sp. b94]|uniref:hypothetical protein n=1 Tax=Streptomyces sp. b94 TaxID=1827634 RepID=UPI001B38704E|nr:hypothetical protein [Streptomyces sp. b94]MBQ1099816.1 hypothetical protein [Streptomyces sp. b94]